MTSTAVNSRSALTEAEALQRIRNRDWSSAAVALMLGLFGLALGRLGELWIRFDVFSQFAVQFIFLTLAAAAALFAPRYKGVVTGILFLSLALVYGLWPHFAAASQEAPLVQDEKRLRAMQFNVHQSNQNVDEIASAVRSLAPDVVTLVELSEGNAPVLEKLRADYPYQATCWGMDFCEMAIISRTPLSNISARGPWKGPLYIQASLGAAFGNLTVVGVHTTRFPYANAQLKQVIALSEHLESTARPLLVMGDFNATPFSRVTKTFAVRLGLTRQTWLPSWPARAGLPQLAIDHIFTSTGIRALDSERIAANAGSDHYPISVTLAVPVE